MIKIEKLNKYFFKGKPNENHVLKEVSLELDSKGLVCILGESGSGKTTLLNTIGGLDTFTSGTVMIGDTVFQRYEPKKTERLRNEKFGYIFQNYYLLQDYTAAYNIKLALNVFDLTEEEKEKRVDYVLESLGMKRYKKKLVSQLSGGQQQRISIARALVKSPEIILADEPTGNLDEENTIKIMSILKSISKECLVVLVSHERDIARFFADRIIEIGDGVIRTDYANRANGNYQRMDDANIYLRDMDVKRMETEGLQVSLYQDKAPAEAGQRSSGEGEKQHQSEEAEQLGKVRLNLAWRDGKLYIQCPDDIPLMLSGEETGCVMLDESRPKLEQSQVEEFSYDLPQVETKKNASLPLREIGKLACENIHMMGKRHKFIVGILLATSILLVLALADYMMQRSVDMKTVVTDDSHYVTVSLEMNQSVAADVAEEEVEKYLKTYVEQGEYRDASVRSAGVLTLNYDGFAQLQHADGGIKNYAVVPVKHLKKESLVLGRMPENRTEIVIDRWLVESFRDSGSMFTEIYRNEEAMLGAKMSTNIPNLQMEIVGISDTGEPSVYVNENLALGMCYSGYYIMSDEDLKELYPGKYDGLKLSDSEIMLTGADYKAYERAEKWNKEEGYQYENEVTVEAEIALDMKRCKIAGEFPAEAGASYVLSQANCDRLRMKYIKNAKEFKVYTDDVEKTIKHFTETGKELQYFQVKAVSSYQQQLEEYKKERQKVDINAGYLVTLAVSLLSFVMIYFTIKSNAMARSEELTVYRLIGISPGSILKAYMLEMILVTAYTCIPAVLVTSGIIKFIVSIPSLQIHLLFPWWLALALLAVLFVGNAVISILPVQGILRKPPAQLAAKE